MLKLNLKIFLTLNLSYYSFLNCFTLKQFIANNL